ncbi:hypothetical protein EYC80_003440 [Monilinia laxa]|uniref:Uncharacterized protein n=1 Tax=Monilinia laxa TaxID=61186 RepID=A0A5N6KE06_MONLA|nr:hypothetical protein EYC80_003440 [Monilinia laxa]
MVSPKILPSPHFPYGRCLPCRSVSSFCLSSDTYQVLPGHGNPGNQQYSNNTILTNGGILTSPLISGLYSKNFHLDSQRSFISNTGVPDFDIPIASIELLDFDHPSAENEIVADLGIDVASMEQTDWGSLGLEFIPSLSENQAQNEQVGIDF